jgi:hypothetical protein
MFINPSVQIVSGGAPDIEAAIAATKHVNKRAHLS